MPDETSSVAHTLDRRILLSRQDSLSSVPKDRGTRALSMGSLSLQPAPRKRFTITEPHTDPPTTSLNGFSFDSPEQKPREPSMRSISTLSTISTSKRWSRQQLPQRLTPPVGPPPAIPRLHPYAAGESPSRRSSVASSRQSTSSRPASSHRTSMPPPRPAPTFALPPAPDEPRPKSNRAFRLSLMAPKPPPLILLPPRPDEAAFPTHRRSNSAQSTTSVPPSPFPPPDGPLPAVPPASPARHSFKQRLRILSAPSYSSSTIITPPGTPIAEKIIDYTTDSFLQMHSPTTPVAPRVRQVVSTEYTELPLSPPPRRASRQISLLERPELPHTPSEIPEEPPEDPDVPPKSLTPRLDETTIPLPLSHQGSVISLGIVSV